MWTTSSGGMLILQNKIVQTSWSNALVLTSLIVSMTVDALATVLIVFRILKVFHDVKDITTSDEKSLGFTGGRKLCSIIFIIIKLGMAWAMMLIIGISSTNLNLAWYTAYTFVGVIHEMLNVIISSIIAALCFTNNMDLARV